MIKFLCPSGHPLSAPTNLAGKQGKCPKCGTAFVVPTPDELAGATAEAAESQLAAVSGGSNGGAEGASPAANSASSGTATDGSGTQTPAMGSGKNLGAGEAFVFLCPNGHKLNGPPSLKGKAGKCPHCGARFRIPDDDDLNAPDEEEVPTGEADEEVGSGQLELEEHGSGGFNFDFGSLVRQGQPEEAGEEGAVEEPLAPPPPGPAALGYIVGRLWDRREEGTELEIFLTEGEIMSPDRYSEVLSSSDFGVFAVQEGDGTFHVTVIPWTAVRRIGMRKLRELSDQMFR